MRKEVRTELVKCDICGKEDKSCVSINYPVMFFSDQTEGRSCEPYISQEVIDVCDSCIKKIIRVKGYGVQGHNNYKELI